MGHVLGQLVGVYLKCSKRGPAKKSFPFQHSRVPRAPFLEWETFFRWSMLCMRFVTLDRHALKRSEVPGNARSARPRCSPRACRRAPSWCAAPAPWAVVVGLDGANQRSAGTGGSGRRPGPPPRLWSETGEVYTYFGGFAPANCKVPSQRKDHYKGNHAAKFRSSDP